MSEEKSFLKRLLTETWPAKMAQDALKAVMLPGDVYQGKVQMYGEDGRTNPEVINRSADLAGLVTLGAGAVPAEANSLRSGIKAYHGSPHDFEKFDLSKIGTGEGAQAYGHGLYFAESEPVAKSYRDTLAKEMFATPSGEVFDPARDLQHVNARAMFTNALRMPERFGADPVQAAIDRAMQIGVDNPTHALAQADIAKLRSIQEQGGLQQIPGSMYEVNINADPSHFLDWDKPLSEQGPKVQDGLRKLWGSSYERRIADPYNSHGQDLAARTMDPVNGRAYTQELRQAGIPGIKYLDQGSRGAGDGSRNYVVFDDNLIDILKKYGLAGASASPLAALMAGQGQGELQQ